MVVKVRGVASMVSGCAIQLVAKELGQNRLSSLAERAWRIDLEGGKRLFCILHPASRKGGFTSTSSLRSSKPCYGRGCETARGNRQLFFCFTIKACSSRSGPCTRRVLL